MFWKLFKVAAKITVLAPSVVPTSPPSQAGEKAWHCDIAFTTGSFLNRRHR